MLHIRYSGLCPALSKIPAPNVSGAISSVPGGSTFLYGVPGLRYGLGLNCLGNGLSGNLFGPTVMGSSALNLGDSKLFLNFGAALFGVCTVGLVKSFGRGGASGTTKCIPFSSGNSSRVCGNSGGLLFLARVTE